METRYYYDYEIRKSSNVGISIKIDPLEIFGIYGVLYFPKKYCNAFITAMKEAKDKYILNKELAINAGTKDSTQKLMLDNMAIFHCFWKDPCDFAHFDRNILLEFYFCTMEFLNENRDYILYLIAPPLEDENYMYPSLSLAFCSEEEIDEFIETMTLS